MVDGADPPFVTVPSPLLLVIWQAFLVALCRPAGGFQATKQGTR